MLYFAWQFFKNKQIKTVLTAIICAQNTAVQTAIIYAIHLMAGVASFCPRPPYYSLWRQDIWRYPHPPYAQNMAVKTAVLILGKVKKTRMWLNFGFYCYSRAFNWLFLNPLATPFLLGLYHPFLFSPQFIF